MRTLIAFLLLARLTLEECLEGCLKCNERDECLFCDFKNNFKIQGISCQAVTINNCSLIDISGNCLACKDKFYLDKATNKCLEIKAGGVTNCIAYNGPSECSACASGFYVFEAQCKAVPTPVANCTLADSNDPNLCKQCSPGFILVPDAKSCTPITEVDNCASYSIASCQTCKAGFLLNSNKYLEDIYQLTSSETQFNLLNKMNYDIINYKDQGYFATCSKITIQNCAEVQDVDKCKVCNENFYLDDKLQCQPYPLEGIANCVVYSNASTCIECSTNFYPQNPTTCSQITDQPNCVQYSSKDSSTICTACSKEYYLNSDKKCILREQSKDILKCAATDLRADVCQTCVAGFNTTSDRLACLPEITMCETYVASTKSDQQLTCTKCLNGFYYDATAKKCQTGSVENCLGYSQSAANVCTLCKNGFYLSGANCLKHSALNNCTTYDAVTSNKCAACEKNFFLFIPQTTCVKANVIEKCSQNQDVLNCAVCQDGFKLTTTTPKRCELITSPSFCLQVDANSPNTCVKCQVGYYLKAGLCISPYQIFTTHCEVNNANGLISESVLACQYCKPNALPWNYKNAYICASKSRFDQTKLITNCLRYKIESSGAYTCTRCPDALVLKTDGTCGDSCAAGQAIKNFEVFNYVTVGSASTDYDNFAVTRNRVCVATAGTTLNCAQLYPELFIQTTRTANEVPSVCRKCNDGFIKYIIKNQITNIEDPDKSKEPKNPLSAFPGIGCKSGAARGAVSNVVIDYCEYYADITSDSSNAWGCVKCQFGFTGKVVEFNGNGYIESCVKLTSCDDSVSKIYDGMVMRKEEVTKYGTFLGAYYSCHVCLSPGFIPFLAISINTASTNNLPRLQKFGLTYSATLTFAAAGSTGLVMECYNPSSPSSLGLTSYPKVDNCGLGVINVSSKMNADDANKEAVSADKVGVFCYACQPGFKPSRLVTDSQAPLMVFSCTAISNCQSSTWFNACSKCNSDFTYRYNPTRAIVEYDVCVSFPSDPNCHAVDVTGTSPVCKYCNKGFNLNADKVCESLIAVQCTDSKYLSPQIFDVKFDFDFHGTGLFLMPQGPGCSQCITDAIGLFISTDTFYCTDSPYLQNKVYPATTTIINNCVNFAMNVANTAFVCKVCKEGYIPTDAGNCVEKSAVPNCLQAKSSQQCSQCTGNFTVVNGLCTQKNIANCLTYDESPTATSLVCSRCDTNFYPSGSKCILGSVVNCKVLKDANTCMECLPSFVLVTIPLGRTYCYPIPSSFNCDLIDPAAFVTNKYKCNSCASGYVILTSEEDLAKSVCFNFTTINNCAEYNYANAIKDSAYSCKTCANGFFLNGTVCQARNVTLRECVTYKIDKDECAACEAGSFVAPDGKTCIKYPTGIKGCRIYKSLSECTACKTGLFFNKTRCDAVPTASQISKCIFYADLTTCTLCEQGFAVSEGKCIQSQATNCLAYASKTACGSCYDRFGFKEDNGIRNCVAIEDKQCLVYQPFFPFKCTTCAPEFYPLNGICTAVTTSVDNCQEYDSPTTCRKCKEGSALHFDKKSCKKDIQVLRLFDPNCIELKWVANPICAKCKPSYFFSNSTCTKCTNNTLDVGCYNCNPKNQTLCYMCNTGFYQKKDSKCTKYSSGLDNQTNTTNTTNKTNTTTGSTPGISSGILWLCIVLLMAV